jgi:hypothetical protein
MLSWDERLMIGLKALERLAPIVRNATLPDAAAPVAEAESPDSNEAGNADRKFDLLARQVDFAPTKEKFQELPVAAYELPTLEALLEGAGELTPYSIVLGICEDGLPFLLDLTNPAPGALLLAADKLSGKTRLLKSILASATYLNSPDEAAFYLVAQFPEQYTDLEQTDHCQGLHAANDKTALGELIEELAQMVEERKHSGPYGPAIILAIDDLHTLLQNIDEQTFTRLYWLIRHGPRSRLWTFAAFSTERAEQIDERFLAAFRTRLIGKIDDRKLAAAVSGDARLNTRRLEKGFEFCVPYGDDWTHFWICEPEAQATPETLSASKTLAALEDLAAPEMEEDQDEDFYPEEDEVASGEM